jgi:hypothetical protein
VFQLIKTSHNILKHIGLCFLFILTKRTELKVICFIEVYYKEHFDNSKNWKHFKYLSSKERLCKHGTPRYVFGVVRKQKYEAGRTESVTLFELLRMRWGFLPIRWASMKFFDNTHFCKG